MRQAVVNKLESDSLALTRAANPFLELECGRGLSERAAAYAIVQAGPPDVVLALLFILRPVSRLTYMCHCRLELLFRIQAPPVIALTSGGSCTDSDNIQ